MDLNIVYNLIEAVSINAIITAISIPLSIGLGLGVTYIGRKGVGKKAVGILTDFVRKTSLYAQLFFVLYIVSSYFMKDGLTAIGLDGLEIYRQFGVWFAAVFAISLNSALYQRVFLQSQINVIHKDQKENANRLRLPEKLQFWKLWLPQAGRASKENYMNEFCEISKASTFIGTFGLSDVLNYTSGMGLRTYDTTLWICIGIATIYVFTSIVLFTMNKVWNAVMGEEK